MTRKELQQVYRLQKELEMWEEKERELICGIDSIGSPSAIELTGVHGSGVSDPTGRIAQTLSEVSDIIMNIIVNIREAQRDIVQLVSGIDDPLLRQIIVYRCYDCMTWNQVAAKTGTSEDAARQIFSRFVRNL